ncbi:MAG TPA: ABC transporter permease [Gemmatimonadaceae bacterium]
MRIVHALRDALARIAGLAHRTDREARLDDEIRFHVDMQTEALVRTGLDPAEARRRALVAFGGRERYREAARDEYRARVLDELTQDVRYCLRSLLNARVFTAAAVGTLALGIGATTAMFSVVDAVLLRRLPYANPNGLVMLWEHNFTKGMDHNSVGPANFLAWRDQTRSFTSMAAFVTGRFTVIRAGSEPVSVQTRLTNASLLPMLGAHPVLGRLFTESEDQPGAPRVAVLSYDFWKQYFGGRPDVVGSTVRINDQDATIVGVLPKDFRFFEPVALWAPIRFPPEARTIGGRYLRVLARLKPGVTVDQADGEMKAIARRRAIEVPQLDANWTALAAPLHEDLVGDSRTPLLVLFGAVGCLLLIACANVANLLLARAADRRREIAVRIALGASPRRIVRQLLTESVMLAVIGAALGIAAAFVGTRLLIALVPPQFSVATVADVGVNARVLLFGIGVALVAGVAFGLFPALQAVRGDAQDALKEGGRTGGADSRRSGRLRAALVVAEISLAVMLLAGTGLMVRSFIDLSHVPLGFEPMHALTAEIVLPSHKYQSDTAAVQFFEDAETRLAALPGVRAVGAISYLPLSGQRSASSFTVVGQPVPPRGQEPVGDFRAVTPGYFRAMGIPIEAGRALEPSDRRDAPEVAVVSRTLARTFWPNESAVGHELRFEWDGWHTVRIVGVAGDVHHDGPRAEPFMEIYRPLEQFPYSGMTMVVRTAGDPVSLARPVRETIRAIDPDQPIAQLRPMTELVSASLGSTRLSTILFGLFGGIGLVLAMIGIYGVGAYTVEQRRHEFGIRMALGARPRDVLAMVVRRGLVLTSIGIVAGVAGALALTHLMRALLFGVAPDDPVTFAWVAMLLAGIAALSSYLPARRATRIDPVSALRSE